MTSKNKPRAKNNQLKTLLELDLIAVEAAIKEAVILGQNERLLDLVEWKRDTLAELNEYKLLGL